MGVTLDSGAAVGDRLRASMQARSNLFAIADMWPLLVEERIPGTPRPWLQSRGRRGRNDPDDPGGFVIHGVTAPVRLDVLDVMTEIVRFVEHWTFKVADVLGKPRPRHVHTVTEDPIRFFSLLHEWWPALEEVRPAWAEEVALGLERHYEAISRTLGLALDGKILPFPCPYCGTVRSLVISKDDELGVVIACTSGVCEPPPSSTHLLVNDRPVWRFAQWENLAAACR